MSRFVEVLSMTRPTLTALLAVCALVALTSVTEVSNAQTPELIARARALFQEGTTHFEAGRFEPASRAFEEAWRILPSPELAYNVARTCERMGDVPRGIRFYRRYLEQAAPDAANRNAIEERIQGLQALEARQREQVFANAPSNDELTREAAEFFRRGVAMFRRGRYEAALTAFHAAYNFAPIAEIAYNMAVASERLNRTREAVDYYREYLRSLERDSAEYVITRRRIRELRRAIR